MMSMADIWNRSDFCHRAKPKSPRRSIQKFRPTSKNYMTLPPRKECYMKISTKKLDYVVIWIEKGTS